MKLMKLSTATTLRTAIIGSLLLMTAGIALAQTPRNAAEMVRSGLKRYNQEHGRMVTKSSGNQTGTEITVWDMWGWREYKKTRTSMSVMGIEQATHADTYLDGEIIYNVNPTTQTGTKITQTFTSELAENADQKSLTAAGEQMIKNMGGKPLGTKDFFGHPGYGYEISKLNSKVWVVQGLTVDSEVDMMGMKVRQTATELDFGYVPLADSLTVPTNVKINDLGNFNGLPNSSNGYKYDR